MKGKVVAIVLIMAFVTLVFAGCVESDEDRILGKWESNLDYKELKPYDNLFEEMNFYPDGVLNMGYGYTTNYRIEDGTIYIDDSMYDYEFVDDTHLIIKVDYGNEVHYTKVE